MRSKMSLISSGLLTLLEIGCDVFKASNTKAPWSSLITNWSSSFKCGLTYNNQNHFQHYSYTPLTALAPRHSI